MQFSSKSTSTGPPAKVSIYYDLQDNFNLMLMHQQQLMGILYRNSLESHPYPQAITHYNQKTTDSYILVNKEDFHNGPPPSLTAPSSDSSEAPFSPQEKNAIQYNQQSSPKLKKPRAKKDAAELKKRKKFESEQQYEPNEDEAFDCSEPKTSQSKNIPKIFGKGILNFIAKNKEYTEKVLTHFGLDPVEFETSLEYFNKHVSSIADLRSMWLPSGTNKFAKAFRVMSKEYVRKHSLCYIFNSRVTSVVKHIKYRQTIQRSIEAPESFTRMKEY